MQLEMTCACVLLDCQEKYLCLPVYVHVSFLLQSVDSLFLKKKSVNHLQGEEIMQAAANLTQG